MENLVAEDSYRDEMARHHQLLRQRMLETEDHFVLLPAWGCAGLNTWD